jgi:hypothetical protein
MSDLIEERDLGNGAVVRVYASRFVDNPRDFADRLSTMWCWHHRYDLSGRKDRRDSRRPKPHHYEGWEELGKAIERDIKPVVMRPVYLYDHSALALSTTPFSCPWDSGQVGFIFFERDKLKAFGAKIATKKVKERMLRYLQADIAEYSAYLNNEVYEWKLYINDELVGRGDDYYGDEQIERMFEEAAASLGALKAS